MSKIWQDREQYRSHRPQFSLFRYIALLGALLFIFSSTPTLLAQDNTGDDQAKTLVYLPAVLTQGLGSNNDLVPLAPETYASEGETAPADAQVVASTYCSTWIKFSNQSSYTIKIYWVNSYGNEVLYKTLNAGYYYWQQTYYGHLWRVRDTSGQLLKQVTVNSCYDIYITITNSNFPQKAGLGDRVWNDVNRNGLQDNNESGISGMSVELWVDSNNDGNHDTLVATATTDSNGNYLFQNLDPSKKYVVKFKPGNCYRLTTPNVGTNDTIDSDAIQFSGYIGTNLVSLTAGQTNSTVDAGFYDICAPTPTATPTNTPVPPTATPTNTPVPPTATPTNTPVPPTATPTNTPVPQLAKLGDRVWEDVNRDGIQNNNEPGIDGIQVELFTCGGTRVQAAVTANGGLYLFTGLPEGCYYVRFVNINTNIYSGFTTSNVGDDNFDSDISFLDSVTPGIINGQTTNIFLPAGADNRSIDAGLVRPQLGSIGDKVWNDTDRDGVQDGGEAGVPNVSVTLLSGCSGNTVVSGPISTNGSGIYGFTGLAAGQYRVQMSNLPAGFVFSPQNQGGNDTTDSDVNTTTGISDCITLAAGQNDPNWDAGINQPPVTGNNCIGDRVWNDINKNGIQDSGEVGVGGATINVENTGGTIVGSAVTDSTGFYQICNLPTNETLFAQLLPPSGYIITGENEGTDDTVDSDFSSLNGYTGGIRVAPGVNDFTIDGGITLATGKIGDRTWEDLNFNGIQDPNEPGFSAIVQLYDGNKNVIIATKTSGADGSYLFTGLTAGDYYVCFSAPPGAPYALGQADQGDNDELDSDPDSTIGCTDLFPLGEGETNLTIDAGFVDP